MCSRRAGRYIVKQCPLRSIAFRRGRRSIVYQISSEPYTSSIPQVPDKSTKVQLQRQPNQCASRVEEERDNLQSNSNSTTPNATTQSNTQNSSHNSTTKMPLPTKITPWPWKAHLHFRSPPRGVTCMPHQTTYLTLFHARQSWLRQFISSAIEVRVLVALRGDQMEAHETRWEIPLSRAWRASCGRRGQGCF